MTGAFVPNNDPQLPASLKIAKKLLEIAKQGPDELAFIQALVRELVAVSDDETSPEYHQAHIFLVAFSIADGRIEEQK